MKNDEEDDNGETADVGVDKDALDESGDNDGDKCAGVAPVRVPRAEGERESATSWLCLQTTF